MSGVGLSRPNPTLLPFALALEIRSLLSPWSRLSICQRIGSKSPSVIAIAAAKGVARAQGGSRSRATSRSATAKGSVYTDVAIRRQGIYSLTVATTSPNMCALISMRRSSQGKITEEREVIVCVLCPSITESNTF